MRFRDLLRLAWGNLWRIKVRTILTAGGVVIGITFMVVMVSIGIGLERTVTGELSGTFQLNQVTVHGGGGYYMPGMPVEEESRESKVLNQRALQEIAKISGVTAVTPVINVPVGEIRLRRDLIWVSILGMDLQQLEHFGFALEEGRPIPKGGSIALAGYRVPEEAAHGDRYFYPGERNEDVERVELTNRRLEIVCRREPEWNNDQFLYDNGPPLPEKEPGEEKIYRVRVAGILEQLNSWEDYSLIVPLDMAEEISEWYFRERAYFQKSGYDEVKVFAADTQEVNRVAEEIKEMGFFAFSLKEMIESTANVFKILQFVMGGIGCVALLIAAVGIANTLIMSIYERTKEIGIIKVVGASIPDIRNLFLLEAGFIGFMGGITGVLCGWLGGLLLNFAAAAYLSQSGAGEMNLVYLPLPVAIFTVIFSAIVGLAAGLYPAIRAANLSAIEAIRYE
jgi:putative ABC transport system permease protein